MIDKEYCMSSYLALRYVEKRNMDFCKKYNYNRPELCEDEARILVHTAQDIDREINKQLAMIKREYNKIGILLSGGMDSAILASYVPGCEAYTFRFLDGKFQEEELQRAELFAKCNNLNLHYVDINWDTVMINLRPIMKSKGGPVHSIEPQICQGALQAKLDGVDIVIIGDGSDYVFGGMDGLLSKDWSFEEFLERYIYVKPEEVLLQPSDVRYLFEKYRQGDGIDFQGFMNIVATEESYGSYSNAFHVANVPYYDPYERLKLAVPLDLMRIRSGESKYLIRELFHMRYPNIPVPEKNPMPRPVDLYFANWKGPLRKEFRHDIKIENYNGNQKWLLWCLEQFLNMVDEE